MNIYLLERKDYGWDEIIAQAIVANTPKEAIEICYCGDEGHNTWLSIKPQLISKYTGKKKNPFVLLSEYRNA